MSTNEYSYLARSRVRRSREGWCSFCCGILRWKGVVLMALADRPGESEFGGVGGLIQPELRGHPSRADVAVDRQGVDDAAMVLRVWARRESDGLVKSDTEVRNDDGTITRIVVQYSEEDVRQELQTPH